MKTRKLAVLVVVAMLLGIFALSACGKGDAEFVGSWKMTSMSTAGTEIDLTTLESFGMTGELVITKDGNVTLDVSGSSQTGTWKAKDSATVTLTFGDASQDAKVANGTLTLEEEDSKIVFEKE